jgi:hypothetical protein
MAVREARGWVHALVCRGCGVTTAWARSLRVGTGEGWLFFIDDRPGANWEHACRYVFVGRGGNVEVVAGQTPPVDLDTCIRMSAALKR